MEKQAQAPARTIEKKGEHGDFGHKKKQTQASALFASNKKIRIRAVDRP
jgi:hypothetical protein